MNAVQHEPYLSNKCHSYVKYLINNYKVLILTHIYSYFKINIQSRCGYPCADSQVGQLVANMKVVQKSISFSKRMWLAIQLLQGGRQSWRD